MEKGSSGETEGNGHPAVTTHGPAQRSRATASTGGVRR
jgi:hypothetical protein